MICEATLFRFEATCDSEVENVRREKQINKSFSYNVYHDMTHVFVSHKMAFLYTPTDMLAYIIGGCTHTMFTREKPIKFMAFN